MPGFTLSNGNDTWPGVVDNTGDDTVFGLAGLDSIAGGAGNDALYGGADRDTLSGGTGDDVLDAGPQPLHDVLDGGAGNDTAVIALEGVVNLATGNSVGVYAAASTQTFVLHIDGSSGPTLSSIENFRITSGDEADGISGAGGNDTLNGGAGRDTMLGGGGSDSFVFVALAHATADATTADQILGFTVDPAASAAFVDRIDLSIIDANTATTVDDRFAFIGVADFSAPGQVRLRQDGGDTIVEVNASGADGVDMSIRLVDVVADSLSAADFVL